MKIGINTLALRQGGGVERYILDLINGFHQAQITPRVYTCKADASLPENQFIELIKHSLAFVPRKLRHAFLSSFVRKNRRPDEKILSLFYLYCDIFICGGNHKGYLASLNRQPNFYERFIKIPFEQKVLNECQQVIAHSRLMKEELMHFYNVPEHKIHVLYPPVDTKKFQPISPEARQTLRQKWGFAENEIIYLFPSTGHKRKGYDILKAFFNTTDLPVKLVVAGTPVEPSNNVISLGFCQNMPELYQAADFTIMASGYEPFGLVGLESVLSGTPIIFSDNMACLEVFQGNFGFTFNRHEPQSLESAVKNSLDLWQKGKARIEHPQTCLNYNPELSVHIDALLNMIQHGN